MPNTSKSSKKTAPVSEGVNPELVDVFTPLVLNSVERVADLQKKTLDVAAQQTAEWMGAWKQAFSYFPVTPTSFLFDVAGQAMQTAIEAQKSAIDMVVEQTQSATSINRVRAEAYSNIASEVSTTFQKSVRRTLEAQKMALEVAGEQTRNMFESTKKQLGDAAGPATVVVDSLQRGADAVIEAQKSFLNMASQPFTANSQN
jgi:hypothetical protein